MENNREATARRVRALFDEGLSSWAIASKLGWFHKPGPGGWVRPLKHASRTIVNDLLGLSWPEYKRARQRLSNAQRVQSGFTAKKKAAIMERDGGCIVCGGTEKLCVHHLDMNKTNNDFANLVTVCTKLHNIIHSNLRAPSPHWNYDPHYWAPRIKLLKQFVKKVNKRKDLYKTSLKTCSCGKHYVLHAWEHRGRADKQGGSSSG